MSETLVSLWTAARRRLEAADAVPRGPAIHFPYPKLTPGKGGQQSMNKPLIVGADLLAAHRQPRAIQVLGNRKGKAQPLKVRLFDPEDTHLELPQRFLEVGDERLKAPLAGQHMRIELHPRLAPRVVEDPVGRGDP